MLLSFAGKVRVYSCFSEILSLNMFPRLLPRPLFELSRAFTTGAMLIGTGSSKAFIIFKINKIAVLKVLNGKANI